MPKSDFVVAAISRHSAKLILTRELRRIFPEEIRTLGRDARW